MSIGSALLVSSDSITIQHLCKALTRLSIAPDVCRETTSAIRLLTKRKFDAFIVDAELGEQSATLLDEVHGSSSNHRPVTFVIGGRDAVSTRALRSKVGFVFERPLSGDSIDRVLKVAYGLILRERRRYFRCPISLPVVILREAMSNVCCYSVNMSEGGMALSTFVPLAPGERVHVQFTLPGREAPFLAEATICWWKTGQLGLRFVALSPTCRNELERWLAQRLEEFLPSFVTNKFQKREQTSETNSEKIKAFNEPLN